LAMLSILFLFALASFFLSLILQKYFIFPNFVPLKKGSGWINLFGTFMQIAFFLSFHLKFFADETKNHAIAHVGNAPVCEQVKA